MLRRSIESIDKNYQLGKTNLYSEPEACKRIAYLMKSHVPWLSHAIEEDDGNGGLKISLCSDNERVQELLGADNCFISIKAIVRVNISFDYVGDIPPETKKIYELSPYIEFHNPDVKDRSRSQYSTKLLAEHLGIKQDEFFVNIFPDVKKFFSEHLTEIAKDYAKYVLDVEEKIATAIISNCLSKEPDK